MSEDYEYESDYPDGVELKSLLPEDIETVINRLRTLIEARKERESQTPENSNE